MQLIRYGSRGGDVLGLQQSLNRRMLRPNNMLTSPPMARLAEDGIFGPKTQAMVKEFQRLNKVQVDGIVGPVTWYLLFPYITFSGRLLGNGRMKGTREQESGPKLRPLQVNRGFGGNSGGLFASPKAKEPVADPKKDKKDEPDEPQGFILEGAIGPSLKHEFKPWFVLKPSDDPAGSSWSGGIEIEATILRLRKLELGAGFEFTKPLGEKDAQWEWEGGIKGAYKEAVTLGPIILSPVADITVKQGLNLGAGIGAEASVKLFNGKLELSVGGKFAGTWDREKGNFEAGPEVGFGGKFVWDFTPVKKKK